MVSPLLVNVAELLREPGARKHLSARVAAGEIDVVDGRIAPDDVVAVEADLESSLDGIVAHGEAQVDWTDTCRRCARPVGGTVRAELHELFQQRLTHEEAAPIVGEQLDLAPAVRDIVLLDTPAGALCRDDCKGLCPTCGADLNEGPCGCAAPIADDRWQALDQLRGDLA